MRRILKAFSYSFDGLRAALASGPAFRQDIIVFVIGIIAAIILPVDAVSRAMLISPLFIILIAELANTAIETIIDRISKENNPLSKNAKDIGSAIVLMSFINAAAVWICVFIHA
ncbi:MAG: diacylglycerol kinase [Rickettsiales bacterium]|nr:diacylglycerol kinase [Rickettsiales bacterium]